MAFMSIAENISEIQNKIDGAARAAGRDPVDVNLVAVSKVQPRERIEQALAAGQRCYGENRVQEACERWGSFEAGLRAEYPDLRLHLIGPLQTNKAREAVALFDVIESLDREKLARALAKEMDKQGRALPCFIQVNVGEEAQKAGIFPVDLDEFYRYCVEACGLDVRGLMCIPPVDEPPALFFALLRQRALALGLSELSMGMSADFEAAIALGATYVRVGTGVFGQRVYP